MKRKKLSKRVDEERVAIWARYNSMVIAVSIFFAGTSSVLKINLTWLPELVGFTICSLWITMHVRGYIIFSKHYKKIHPNKSVFDAIFLHHH